jgi:signal transduction histidine kinase
MNQFNKRQIKSKFEEITIAEGITIRYLLEISAGHLVAEGEDRLTSFLDRLYNNESIIYIGLFKGEELDYLLSRFEGFFPVVPGRKEYRILDTPAGKIFEIASRFKKSDGTLYRLYIGFNYEFLTAFETAAGRSFFLVAVLFSLLMMVLMALIYYFDKKFFHKELELVQEKQEKERFKELSLLTSEIAHEIKNPLNSIYLSFNTLEKHCSTDEEALFYRQAIKAEIKRISTILQSYADLSKEIRPQYADLELGAFADSFAFMLEAELKDRRVSLHIEVDRAQTISTDENLLKQILLNLVKNASEADASDVFVHIGTKGKELVLEVRDNGKGIGKSAGESLFKPYFSTKTKGMGLGLHITLRLVQALNGQVTLVSGEPGNTSFQVNLPLENHR